MIGPLGQTIPILFKQVLVTSYFYEKPASRYELGHNVSEKKNFSFHCIR
jgi:hypothetical protein